MPSRRLFTRAVVRVAPLDDSESAADFLQGLLTNDVSTGLPTYAALLSAQGKTLFDLIVWPGADGALLLDCEASLADDLVKRLSLYRLRRKLEIVRDDTLGVYWQREAQGDRALDPRLAALGQRWIAATSAEDKAGDDEWLAHRLSLGVPEGQAELGEVLWLETNAMELNGVSFEKGCYIGQENTARMNWRQKVNRRVIVVPLEQSDAKRCRAQYPALGLAVDHLRVADIDPSFAPDWLALSPQ